MANDSSLAVDLPLETGAQTESTLAKNLPMVAADYFLSRLEGEGHFRDRFGKVHTRFSVVMQGRRQAGGYLIDEVIRYENGDEDSHIWDIQEFEDGRLEARRADIIGVAKGRVGAVGLNWKYLLKLPNGLKLRFDDWMVPVSPTELVNTAKASKFGIFVGEMELAVRRYAA